MKRRFYLFLYDLIYHQLAWAYDAISWTVSLGRWDSWRRAVLPFVAGERVLEVGFGTGALLPILGRGRIGPVVGLDASPAMHRITARRAQRRGLRLSQVQGMAQALPFAEASFDTIVATFPAGFILDPAVHREFARILRPGGRLLAVDVALASRHPLLRLFFHLLFPPAPKAEERFMAAAEGAGLRVSTRPVGQGAVRVVITAAEKMTNRYHPDE